MRIRLHYLAGRREDRLVFDYQTRSRAQFGSARHGRIALASEQLMQRYYRAAKAITRCNTILLQNLDARIAPPLDKEHHAINERFGSRGMSCSKAARRTPVRARSRAQSSRASCCCSSTPN